MKSLKGDSRMKIREIVNELELEVVTGNEFLEREIHGGCVGDLLSVVMGKGQEDSVWVTVQSHINIIAVATLIGLSCVIVSEGFSIDEDAVHKAVEEEVVLLTSKESSFTIVSKLAKLGV